MLACNTPVPTPTGWTNVEYLTTGGWVFDESGYPVRIKSLGEPELKPTLKIGLANRGKTVHEWLTTTEDHPFLTWQKRDMYFYSAMTGLPMVPDEWASAEAKPITAAEIAKVAQFQTRGAEHFIPVTFPLTLQPKDFRVPPYIMGLVTQLRDPEGGSMTCPEWMWDWYSRIFEDAGFPVTRIGKPLGIRARNNEDKRLKPVIFSSAKLNKELSYFSGINLGKLPENFLRGSALQRYEVLQGLLDIPVDWFDRHGDRNICKDKRGLVMVWCGKRERLSEQVVELIRSIGYAGYVKHDPRSETYTVSWMPIDNPYKHPRFRTALGNLGSLTNNKYMKFAWRISEADDDLQVASVRSIEVEGPNKMMTVGKTFCPVVADGN